jgi:hypothetical protein
LFVRAYALHQEGKRELRQAGPLPESPDQPAAKELTKES